MSVFKFVSICQKLQFTQPVLSITKWRTATPSHKRYRNRKITAFWYVTPRQWVSVPDISKKHKTMGDVNPATQRGRPETFKNYFGNFKSHKCNVS